MFNLDDLSSLGTTVASPKNYDFLKDLDLDSDVVRRLNLHLNNLNSGSNLVYLTPIGKDNDPDLLLDLVDKLFDQNKDKINVNLSELEMSNRSKFGPRSIAKPWMDRLDSLLDYFKHQDDKVNSNLIIPKTKVNFTLRPLDVPNAVAYLKNSTNSGLPFYIRKSKIKDTLVRDYHKLLKRQDPCILFTRTQESGKTRNV